MNETTTKEHTMSKQVHVSHASCDHDKTPAARAKCRRIRRGGAPETTKAQIVARVKGTEVPKAKIVKRKKGKGVEIVDEVPAPVLRELVRLEQLAEDGVDVHVVQVEDEREAPIEIVKTVQAKGSKVVHVRAASGGVSLFACTKQTVKDDAQLGASDMTSVTCKNCLKLGAK